MTPNERPVRVLHVITGLTRGGAERLLESIVLATRDRAEHVVVSLKGQGPVGEALAARGVPVHALSLRASPAAAWGVARLAPMIRHERADVVHTWLYHADLLGGLAARAVGVPVLWSLHGTELPPGASAATRAARVACGRLAPLVPARIVATARSAIEAHVPIGYPRERCVCIENAIDTTRFAPATLDDRARMRDALGLSGDAVIVGVFARFHPQKGHAVLADALSRLVREQPGARLLLCGEGTQEHALAALLERHGLRERALCLGPRDDMPSLYSALDVACLPSVAHETTPLFLSEAMASGVPCVATDVGDVRALVGPGGLVVPPGDAAALAGALRTLLALEPAARRAMGAAGREHVRARFDLPQAADRYVALWREVAGLSRSTDRVR